LRLCPRDDGLACTCNPHDLEHDRVTQSKSVPTTEGACAQHPLAVDERAIRAAQIFDDIPRALLRQSSVMPADLRIFDDDVIVCLAANRDDGLVEVKRLPDLRALLHDKLPTTGSHPSLLSNVRCLS
jgi:hypothetical protein